MKRLNLLEKDLHITEKRKIFFVVPAVIMVVAAIFMIIFNFTLGSPLNLGTDFTGGYSIDVKLGNKLNDSNYDYYCNEISDILSTVTADNGNSYNVRIDNMQDQGSGDTRSIHVKYFSVRGASESEMVNDVNPAIQRELEEQILMILPTAVIDGITVSLTYNDVITVPMFEDLKTEFIGLVDDLNQNQSANITFTGSADDAISLNAENNKQIIVTCATINATDDVEGAIEFGMKISDKYAGSIEPGDTVGAIVSTELLFNAILAVCLALVFMLCYIGIRFQLSSGLACIISLFHDILIMFAFMAIFRIEINSTFIAALITILGYSINNSIIVFDRVRENSKSIYCSNFTPEQLANKSIKETLLRSINTTITTLMMIAMVAIIGVTDIRIFAFPIIIGLLAGTYSSIFIAPSLWALFQRVGKSKKTINITPKKEKDKKGIQEEKAIN